jgi:putative aminopeptidase FrvX
MKREHRWLVDLTALPTASGLEGRPIEWIERWAARRKGVRLRRDAVGNLVLEPVSRSRRPKVWMTAHLDHPAFVARSQDGTTLHFEFRGGVRSEYFERARVDFGGARGTVIEYESAEGLVLLDRRTPVAPGSIGRWVLDRRRLGIRGDLLHAHACDDLAGAAAALVAFDRLRRTMPNVGVLFTRGEEMGFLGAIGACKSGTIPRSSIRS